MYLKVNTPASGHLEVITVLARFFVNSIILLSWQLELLAEQANLSRRIASESKFRNILLLALFIQRRGVDTLEFDNNLIPAGG